MTMGPGTVIILTLLAMFVTGLVLGFVWEAYLITTKDEE